MNILKIKTEKREIGSIGEDAAVKLLKKCGYKILKRNYTAVGNEIDVIVQNKEYIVFVEVKTRTLEGEQMPFVRPAAAVTPEKQRRIIKTAKFFLGTYPKGRMVRFDVVEVYLDKNKKVHSTSHLEGAFNYNTAHPVCKLPY